MSPPETLPPLGLSKRECQAWEEDHGGARCAGCGCTDMFACRPPCSWAVMSTAMVEAYGALFGPLHRYIGAPAEITLCSACAPTHQHSDAWPEPRPCVAPTWPRWEVGEDDELVWIRADLIGRAAAVVVEDPTAWFLQPDGGPYRLRPSVEVMCAWLRAGDDYDPGRYPDPAEWRLIETHAEDAGDDVAAYIRFNIVYEESL